MSAGTELNDKVLVTKNALIAAVSDNVWAKYTSNMKMWFRHKWTKEEFDTESRKFFTPEQMHLHNRFFLAMLNKMDAYQMPPPPPPSMGTQQQQQTGANTSTSSSSSKSRKRKRSSRDRFGFEQQDILDFIKTNNTETLRPPSGTEANLQMWPTQRYCRQEMFLPDPAFMLGRLMIGAWEVGLVNVDDNVAECMINAIQIFLKNLLSGIIMKLKHYKSTADGSFYYDVGATLRDPSLRNTVTRQKLDDTPLYLDKRITSPSVTQRPNDDVVFLAACEEVTPPRTTLITLRELQIALKDRNLIGSHSIYSINMERITQMLH
ncbi:transcriptional adapter 1-like [Teleopsis dalmanni]|uniref:transcriptional adapter 1-like n=1 Tax=Teleopsis dalmanni TaxID=139649 RepID=UPI0018CE4562|nr:transcriptional adapter 1-like [Teleopsis dalmanni]